MVEAVLEWLQGDVAWRGPEECPVMDDVLDALLGTHPVVADRAIV